MIILILALILITALAFIWYKEPRIFLFLFYRAAFPIPKGNPVPVNKTQLFPESRLIEQDWRRILEEFEKAFQGKTRLPRFHEVDKANHKISFDTGPAWKTIVLKAYDGWFDQNCTLFPYTYSLLKEITSVSTVLFSILEPHVHIPPHTGKLSGLFRYHLALKVPSDSECFIEINKKKYSWKTGEGILFDDTFLHSVTNNTEELRVVLFLDIKKESSFIKEAITQCCFRLITSSPMFKRSLTSGTIHID